MVSYGKNLWKFHENFEKLWFYRKNYETLTSLVYGIMHFNKWTNIDKTVVKTNRVYENLVCNFAFLCEERSGKIILWQKPLYFGKI